jgi:hypothetical protein
VFISEQNSTGHNDNTEVNDKSFEYVAEFMHWRTAQTDQNCLCGEVKGELKSENAPYHSAPNPLCSLLLSDSPGLKCAEL